MGFVRSIDSGKEMYEYTHGTDFKDLTNKIFYYRTYNDTAIHSINLAQLNFAENAPRLKMPIADNPIVMDYTKNFLQTATTPAITTPVTTVKP